MLTSPTSNKYASPALRSSDTLYTEIISPKLGFGTSKSKKDLNPEDYGECIVKPARVPPHPVTPTFTASYPGSGAKMTWNLIGKFLVMILLSVSSSFKKCHGTNLQFFLTTVLLLFNLIVMINNIEALTGMVTGDDFQLNGHQNMVSIKTHFPSHEGREIPGAENVPRAVLLVRHPLYSIPSYYNYLYEMENNLENHSTRAPLEAWIQWRNDNFDRQLQVWRRHTEYWMDHYSKTNRLVVAYENLTDDEMGPVETTRIAEFLSRSDGVDVRDAEEIPCVWFKVVKYKKAMAGKGRRLQEKDDPDPSPKNEAEASVSESVVNEQKEGKVQQPPPTEEVAKKPKPALSNPAAPQSKRSGPKYVAPYTEMQFRDLMAVLTQLLERYRDEKALAPVLVRYIDEVERRIELASKPPSPESKEK